MCHFITAICSSKATLTDINLIARAYGLNFHDCDNQHIQKQLSKKEKYLWKHTKECDCGTAIGEASQKNDKTERVQKSETDKLRKKGWSESKIARLIADRKKTEDKVAQQNTAILHRKSHELENYVNFLQDLIKKTETEYFGLLLHWYSKGVETEHVKLTDKKFISSKDLTTVDLKTLEEDILLCVTKQERMFSLD